VMRPVGALIVGLQHSQPFIGRFTLMRKVMGPSV
tara:strand:- start:99697 stop:99798 length:102 start_codon:yes stop_codon:yes gene_type:complete